MKLPDVQAYRGASPPKAGKRAFSLLAPDSDNDGSSAISSSSRSSSTTSLGTAAAESTGASRGSPIAELEKAWAESPPGKGGGAQDANSHPRHPVYGEVPPSSAFSFAEDMLGISNISEEDDLWHAVEQGSQGLGEDLWPTLDQDSLREGDELWPDLDQESEGVPAEAGQEGNSGSGGGPGLVAGGDDDQRSAKVGLDNKDPVKREHVEEDSSSAGGRESPAACDLAKPADRPVGFPPLPLDPPPHVLQLLKLENGSVPKSEASSSAGIPDDDDGYNPPSRQNVVDEPPKPTDSGGGVKRAKEEIGTTPVSEAPESVGFAAEGFGGGGGGPAGGHGLPATGLGAGGGTLKQVLPRSHPRGHHPVYGVVPTLSSSRSFPFAGLGVPGGGGGDGGGVTMNGDTNQPLGGDGAQGPAKRTRLAAEGAREDVADDGGGRGAITGGDGGVVMKQELRAEAASATRGPVRRKKKAWVSLTADDTVGCPPLDPSPWPSQQTLPGDGIVATVVGSPEAGGDQLFPSTSRAVSPEQKHPVQSFYLQPPEPHPPSLHFNQQTYPQQQQQAEPPLPQEQQVHRRRQRQKNSSGGTCKHPGCGRGRTCGHAAGPGSKATYCTKHKRPGMVNLVTRRCADELCSTAPSYGFDGKRPTFCKKHRLEGMINVVSPRCIAPGCSSCASYGLMSGGGPKYCAKHKVRGMTNVVSRKCSAAGCDKTPSFGREGDSKASFCMEHKLAGMVNVVTLKCLAPGCRKAPSFGMENDRKASYCKAHMQAGMVNITYSRNGKTGSTVSV